MLDHRTKRTLKKIPSEPLVGILSLDRKRTYYLYSSTHHFGDPSVYDLLHGHLATSELAPRNLLDFRTHVSSLLTLHRESKKYSKGSRRSRRYSHRLIVSGIYPHTISNADISLIWNSLQGIYWTSELTSLRISRSIANRRRIRKDLEGPEGILIGS